MTLKTVLLEPVSACFNELLVLAARKADRFDDHNTQRHPNSTHLCTLQQVIYCQAET